MSSTRSKTVNEALGELKAACDSHHDRNPSGSNIFNSLAQTSHDLQQKNIGTGSIDLSTLTTRIDALKIIIDVNYPFDDETKKSALHDSLQALSTELSNTYRHPPIKPGMTEAMFFIFNLNHFAIRFDVNDTKTAIKNALQCITNIIAVATHLPNRSALLDKISAFTNPSNDTVLLSILYDLNKKICSYENPGKLEDQINLAESLNNFSYQILTKDPLTAEGKALSRVIRDSSQEIYNAIRTSTSRSEPPSIISALQSLYIETKLSDLPNADELTTKIKSVISDTKNDMPLNVPDDLLDLCTLLKQGLRTPDQKNSFAHKIAFLQNRLALKSTNENVLNFAISLGKLFDQIASTLPINTLDTDSQIWHFTSVTRLTNKHIILNSLSLENAILSLLDHDFARELNNTNPDLRHAIKTALKDVSQHLIDLSDSSKKNHCATFLIKLQTALITLSKTPALADPAASDKKKAIINLATEVGKAYDNVILSFGARPTDLVTQRVISTSTRLDRLENNLKLTTAAEIAIFTPELLQELTAKIASFKASISANASVNDEINHSLNLINNDFANKIDTEPKKANLSKKLINLGDDLIQLRTPSALDLARTVARTSDRITPVPDRAPDLIQSEFRLMRLRQSIQIADASLPNQNELADAINRLIQTNPSGINNSTDISLNKTLEALSKTLTAGYDTPQKKKKTAGELLNVGQALLISTPSPISDQIKTLVKTLGKSFDEISTSIESTQPVSTATRLQRLEQALKLYDATDAAIPNACKTFRNTPSSENPAVNKCIIALCNELSAEPAKPINVHEKMAALELALIKNFPTSVEAKNFSIAISTKLNEKIHGASIQVNAITRIQHLAATIAQRSPISTPTIPPSATTIEIDLTPLSKAIEKLSPLFHPTMTPNVEKIIRRLTRSLNSDLSNDDNKLKLITRLNDLEIALRTYGASEIASTVTEALIKARRAIENVPRSLPEIDTLFARTTTLKNTLNALPSSSDIAIEKAIEALKAFMYSDPTASPLTIFPGLVGGPIQNILVDSIPPAPPALGLLSQLQNHKASGSNKDAVTSAITALKALVDADTGKSLDVLTRRVEQHHAFIEMTNETSYNAFNQINDILDIDVNSRTNKLHIDGIKECLAGLSNSATTKNEAREHYFTLEYHMTKLYGNALDMPTRNHTLNKLIETVNDGKAMWREKYDIPIIRKTPFTDLSKYNAALEKLRNELNRHLDTKKYKGSPQELVIVQNLIKQYEQLAAALHQLKVEFENKSPKWTLETLNTIDDFFSSNQKKIASLKTLTDLTLPNIDTTVASLRQEIELLHTTGSKHIMQYTMELKQTKIIKNRDGTEDKADYERAYKEILQKLGADDDAPAPAGLIATTGATVPKESNCDILLTGSHIIANFPSPDRRTPPSERKLAVTNEFRTRNNSLTVETRFTGVKYDRAAPMPPTEQKTSSQVFDRATQQIDINAHNLLPGKQLVTIPNASTLNEFANTVAQMLAQSADLRKNREITINRNIDACESNVPAEAYLLCLAAAGIKVNYHEFKNGRAVSDRDKTAITQEKIEALSHWLYAELKKPDDDLTKTLSDGFKALLMQIPNKEGDLINTLEHNLSAFNEKQYGVPTRRFGR